VSAKAGIAVVLLDRDLSLAERGKATVQKALEKQLEKGRTTRERVDKILSLIEPADSRAMVPMDAIAPSCGVCPATSLSRLMRVRFAPMSSCRSVAMRVRMAASSRTRATR